MGGLRVSAPLGYVTARFGTLGMMMSLGAGEILADLIAAEGRTPVRFKHLLQALSPATL